MNNTTNTNPTDEEICEDCKVWACDCYCDEIADQYREIARHIY